MQATCVQVCYSVQSYRHPHGNIRISPAAAAATARWLEAVIRDARV